MSLMSYKYWFNNEMKVLVKDRRNIFLEWLNTKQEKNLRLYTQEKEKT